LISISPLGDGGHVPFQFYDVVHSETFVKKGCRFVSRDCPFVWTWDVLRDSCEDGGKERYLAFRCDSSEEVQIIMLSRACWNLA
jgi:hypothetical protein